MGFCCIRDRGDDENFNAARYTAAENFASRPGSAVVPRALVKEPEKPKFDDRAKGFRETGLTQLGSAVDVPSGVFGVDIIAVHGLKGHPFKSWTYNEKGKECYWLQDYLLKDLPGARLFAFGYNARITLSRSVETIRDYAKELIDELEMKCLYKAIPGSRPIVFICHSMGGLVCKQALILAHEDKKYKPLLNATKGIFFFGTPHKGSKIANQLGMITPLLNVLTPPEFFFKGKPLRSELIGQLKVSRELEDLCASFVKRTDDLTCLISFYEREKTVDRLVVPKDSCTIGVTNENLIPLSTNHGDMCRIKSRDDTAYLAVLQNCERIGAESLKKHTKLDEEGEQCLESLAISTFTATLAPKKSPAEETCGWLLSEQRYERWRHGRPSVLWISGKSGCGKSTLLHFIRQKMLEHRTFKSNVDNNSAKVVNVCSFFCDNRNKDLATATAILQGLIWDLVSLRRDLIKCVLDEYEPSRPWLYTQLLRTFQALLNHPELGNTCVIIDAIDECEWEGRNTLLHDLEKYIHGFQKTNSSRVTFLMSSHAPIPKLDTPSSLLALDNDQTLREHILTDIHQYVKASLRFSGRFETRSKGEDGVEIETESELEQWTKTIVQKSEGSFLWTALVLDRIYGRPSFTIDVIMDECPLGLSSIYYTSLEKIEDPDHQKVLKAFRIIFAAKRPLTVADFKAALYIENHHRSLADLDRTINEDKSRFVDSMPKLLGDLVQLADDRITFCHNAVKDFLTCKLASSPIPDGSTIDIRDKFEFSEIEAEGTLAASCMDYLNLQDFAKKRSSTDSQIELFAEAGLGGVLDPQFDNIQESPEAEEHESQIDGGHCPFLEYAASNWGFHYASSKSQSKELMNKARKLCASDRRQCAFDNWLRIYRRNYLGPTNLPTSVDALLVAAYFDHAPLCLELAVENRYSSSRALALAWASRMGSRGVVDVLLDLGISCAENVLQRSSAIYWAAAGGFLGVIETFLDHQEASINVKSGKGHTPLMMAVANTHVEVVEGLLKIEALDIKARCLDQRNAFLYVNVGRVSSLPELDILRMLLEKQQIDITARDKHGRTLVSYAAEYGNTDALECVRRCRERRQEWEILLDDNGDDLYGCPPFIWAAWKGKLNVVKYFCKLKQAVKMFRKSTRFERDNAFSLAAKDGRVDVIRCLAERFPVTEFPQGINQQNKDGWTPISFAMWGEARTETIKVLLECGADPNIADNNGRTPWSHGEEHRDAREALIKHSQVEIVESHGPSYHPQARVIDDSEHTPGQPTGGV